MLKTPNTNEYEPGNTVKKEIGSRSELFRAHLASPTFFSDILKHKQYEEVRHDVRV